MSSSAKGVPPAGAPRQSQGRTLFVTGLAGLFGVMGYYGFSADVRHPAHLPIALTILFLAAVPSLLWAKRGRATLPVFEVLLLTTANVYALPLLNGHKELIFYSAEDITTAGWAVIAYQLAALGAYELVRGKASTHGFWRDEVISGDISRWLSYGMVLNTIYLVLSTFTSWVPENLLSVLRAIFFGIGIVCTCIMSRRLGARELSATESVFFIVNLVAQCAIMTSTLFLVGAVSVLLLALIGYVSGSGKIPLVACGAALAVIALLHNGKAEMRSRYWTPDERIQPSLTELPAFFSEWVGYGVRFRGDDEEAVTSKLIDRTSLFHLMCLVVSVTPSQQPYLDGETYRDIPAQFVPRFFWPDKPLGHVSTSRLSVYYGLQREEDTLNTTIGFGLVTEAYANFGFLGVCAVGALLGAIIKKVQCWAHGASLFTYGGLLLVILLAWSFQTEFTLSIWLASLYQACVGVLVIPFALRRIFG
jgi:hypothetical protein